MPFVSSVVNAVYAKHWQGELSLADADRFQREIEAAQRVLQRPIVYVVLMDDGRPPSPAVVRRLVEIAETNRDNLDSAHIVLSRPGLLVSMVRAVLGRMMLLSPVFAQKFAVRASLEDALAACAPRLGFEIKSTAAEIRHSLGLTAG